MILLLLEDLNLPREVDKQQQQKKVGKLQKDGTVYLSIAPSGFFL